MSWGGYWKPYVPATQRQANAKKAMEKLSKKGVATQPVKIEGRLIATTFWGKKWCEHLEAYSDFANRLPRGRTYVRNGSVCHLDIKKGQIEAKVMGSELYTITIGIKALPGEKWRQLKVKCAGGIGSLLELLQGRLSEHVMTHVTDRDQGLFPSPNEIELECSCPDWADMCKHIAAVLYGVGARLDEKPDLLFLLRGVDHTELINTDSAKAVTSKASSTGRIRLEGAALSDVFGIDLAVPTPLPEAVSPASAKTPATPLIPKPTKGPAKEENAQRTAQKTKVTKTTHTVTAKKTVAKGAKTVSRRK